MANMTLRTESQYLTVWHPVQRRSAVFCAGPEQYEQ